MKKSNNVFKRVGIAVLATLITMSFAACGGDPNVDRSPNEVQIYWWNSGYGVEVIQEIIADFNDSQDQYHATLEYDSNATTIISSLSLGKSNKYDVYFTMLNNMQYKNDFVSLEDVLDSTYKNETKTIREKYNPSLLNGVKDADGTTSILTYGSGWAGLVYNADIIDGENYKVPYTTDELELLTIDLLSTNISPWIFFNTSNPGYWTYPMTAWQVQYDGLDYYNNNLLQLKDDKGDSPSKDVLIKKDGRYEALQVLSKILTPQTVHPESAGGGFMKMQTLLKQGKGAFMPNGSWLLNETRVVEGSANLNMMKMPVISSIVNKLENTEMKDSTLSAIVQEIDAGATSSELCSQNDFDRIKAARNIMYNNGAETYTFIPKYSAALDGAKEFLKYFYSDEALVTFLETTGGTNSANLCDASKFDMTKLNAWGQRQFQFSNELTAVTKVLNQANLYNNTGLDSWLNLNYPLPLCAQNTKDRKTVDELWTELVNKVQENWEEWN